MKRVEQPLLVQVGCGSSPIDGWRNFDNSPSVRLARWPILVALLHKLNLISPQSIDFIKSVRSRKIEFADVRSRIPFDDRTVDVLYASHMMEHMDREDAKAFLQEAIRILKPGGILRLALPDLEFMARKYVADGDLLDFMTQAHLTKPRPRTLRAKLAYLLVGDRHHQWMYDAPHLVSVLTEAGFHSVEALRPGVTKIRSPGQLNLSERFPESVYVEGIRP